MRTKAMLAGTWMSRTQQCLVGFYFHWLIYTYDLFIASTTLITSNDLRMCITLSHCTWAPMCLYCRRRLMLVKILRTGPTGISMVCVAHNASKWRSCLWPKGKGEGRVGPPNLSSFYYGHYQWNKHGLISHLTVWKLFVGLYHGPNIGL